MDVVGIDYRHTAARDLAFIHDEDNLVCRLVIDVECTLTRLHVGAIVGYCKTRLADYCGTAPVDRPIGILTEFHLIVGSEDNTLADIHLEGCIPIHSEVRGSTPSVDGTYHAPAYRCFAFRHKVEEGVVKVEIEVIGTCTRLHIGAVSLCKSSHSDCEGSGRTVVDSPVVAEAHLDLVIVGKDDSLAGEKSGCLVDIHHKVSHLAAVFKGIAPVVDSTYNSPGLHSRRYISSIHDGYGTCIRIEIDVILAGLGH